MIKLLLPLLISLISISQNPNFETKLLSLKDITDSYPNGMCFYYDADGETLFDGKEFDKSHPDSELVYQYRCLYFEDEPFNSSLCALSFWAFPDGQTMFYSAQFVDEQDVLLFEFYKDKNNKMRFSD